MKLALAELVLEAEERTAHHNETVAVRASTPRMRAAHHQVSRAAAAVAAMEAGRT